MYKIDKFQILREETATVIQFTTNHTISNVKVICSEKQEDDVALTVKYVQNGVISDLLPFGTARLVNSRDVMIKSSKPVTVSHFYIMTSKPDVVISDVEVYEEDDSDIVRFYPAHIDVDLKENYYLDQVSVFLPENGYWQYSIFTSLNGRDFDLLAEKNTKEKCDQIKGDVFEGYGKEARIIRVYLEYNSASAKVELRDIKITGRQSKTPIQERPDLYIESFKNSKYNREITFTDTVDELFGIIDRNIGKKYRDWFQFEIKENPRENGYDYFRLSDEAGKVLIRGNSGVSLATGLNYYLKYYCQVNISQVGSQTRMPKTIQLIGKIVFKETKAKVRYAYNYCTHSYSMPFWGENEWRKELDWLALNGINVVLDITAQEEVWRRFLGYLGYEHEQIKDFIAGPAFYAWAYMANLSGFGGPVHDTWFVDRTELARKNQFIMRKLGISPVLQGYSGMVPNDIGEHDSQVHFIPQGKWCSFERPGMLKTTEAKFEEYAEMFYQAQKEVYGCTSHYYATDPFHEGGNTSGMSPRDISKGVLNALLKSDSQAVWMIQAWQRNPSSELLAGIEELENGKEHAMILDLYAEKMPHFDEGAPGNISHGYDREFNYTPWVFCMLNNFGGRLGLHGHLDNLAHWIPKAYNESQRMTGIGMTPEASENNPVLYDFLFESVWHDNAAEKLAVIDLKEWIKAYVRRRYGTFSNAAYQAWLTLLNTVYKAEYNNLGQGAPESVMNARPALNIRAASTWGNAVICYDKEQLKYAAELLLEDYELLKESEGYRYDLVTVLEQVLSNDAQDYYQKMVEAYNQKDISGFDRYAHAFKDIANDMEKILRSSEYYSLGKWIEAAKALAEKADDFAKKIYEFNAKVLITTWGSFRQSEVGLLHDYSNRQWSGLIGDFYKQRWERFIREKHNELESLDYVEEIDWFEWEWQWVRSRKIYPCMPEKIELDSVGKKILSRGNSKV